MTYLRRTLAALLLVTVVGAVATAGLGWSQGWRLFAVRTGSMAPTISPGDAVLTRPARHVLPGDVVTFTGGTDGLTTHRVVDVTRLGFQTKGDANATKDIGYRWQSDLVGREVVRIPLGGYLLVFLKQPRGLAGALLVALMAYLALGLVRPSASGRHRLRTPAGEALR